MKKTKTIKTKTIKLTKKQKDIQRILKATKETELTLKTVDVLMSNMRIPVEMGKQIKDILFSQKNLEDLRSRISNVYDEIFTAKEISQLADFYESSIGEKFVNNAEKILEKTLLIGREWGSKIYYDSEIEITKIINNHISKESNIPIEYLEKQTEKENDAKGFVTSKLDIIKGYIKSKGWDANKLTSEQSVEIVKFIKENY